MQYIKDGTKVYEVSDVEIDVPAEIEKLTEGLADLEVWRTNSLASIEDRYALKLAEYTVRKTELEALTP